MAADSLAPSIAALLAASGRGSTHATVVPLAAGGNNRVYSVTSGGERLAVKWYFHDEADPRDRLGAEYAFLEHAWRHGLRCVPQPHACDRSAHLALYEFVEGVQLEPATIDARCVHEASCFFAALNSASSRAGAGALANASEACYSVTEHFRMVDSRIARLEAMPCEPGVATEAATVVAELAACWEREKRAILARCGDPDAALGPSERCLSPSDFGFHNALRRADGSLCFIDFEYAGWDDPAKAVGDFFSHPGVPVPRHHFGAFLDVVCAPLPNPAGAVARARMLEPVFRVKWCCIILNEFLPAASLRRRFADPVADLTARKRLQLTKARALIDSLNY
jgi:hypothetical protein